MAPTMGSGGSYSETMADPEEECGSARKKQHSEAREEKLRWADCVEEELGKREEPEEEREEGEQKVEDECRGMKGSLQKEEELRAKVDRNMRRKGECRRRRKKGSSEKIARKKEEHRRREKKKGSEKSVRKKGERKRREKSKRKR